jgi:hypothetical protein
MLIADAIGHNKGAALVMLDISSNEAGDAGTVQRIYRDSTTDM